MSFGSISDIYTLVSLLGQWCKPVVRSFRFCTYLKLCEFNCECVQLSTVVLCLILSLLHNCLSAVAQYSAHSITVCLVRGAASAINLLPCYVVALFHATDTAIHESEAYLHSSLLCGKNQIKTKKNPQIQKQTKKKTTFGIFFLAMLGTQAC